MKILETRENLVLLKTVEKRMAAGALVSPKAEAEDLVRHFGGMNRVEFFSGQKTVSPEIRRRITRALERRLKGFPLGYVLGETEFFGRRFFVTPGTLVPRPETEFLAEETLKILDRHYFHQRSAGKNPSVLDVGTGCGNLAVSLTIERPDCKMTALDVCDKALRVARKNINFHGLRKKITLQKGDLFSVFGATSVGPTWDVIVSNPPYIPSEDLGSLPREVRLEPRLALDGGPGGTRALRALLRGAARRLRRGGWLLAEIGDGQSAVLTGQILEEGFLRDPKFVKDGNGIGRVLVARKNG